MTFVCLPPGHVMQIDLSMYYTAKNAQVATSLLTSCNNLLQQAYQDAFIWLATACNNRSVALCQQASVVASYQRNCYKLISSTGMLQLVSTSCFRSANDKLQQD